MFITLEDEHGVANLIVRSEVFEKHRQAVLRGRLLYAQGRFQKDGLVQHVIVETLTDMSSKLALLTQEGRDGAMLAMTPSRADRVGRFPEGMGNMDHG